MIGETVMIGMIIEQIGMIIGQIVMIIEQIGMIIEQIGMIIGEIAEEAIVDQIGNPKETIGVIGMVYRLMITLIATKVITTTTTVQVIVREEIVIILVVNIPGRVTSSNVLQGSRDISLVSNVNLSSRFSVLP